MSNALSEADAAGVRQAWDAMIAATYELDWDTYFGHITDDFVGIDPRFAGPTRGKAVWKEWVKFVDPSDPQGSFTVEEISGSGDLAFVVFGIDTRWKEGGKPVEAKGKGLSLFVRGADGRWRMSHQAWNADP